MISFGSTLVSLTLLLICHSLSTQFTRVLIDWTATSKVETMSGKTRESAAEALPTRRERAPSYASTHSASQPRVLNERILVVRLTGSLGLSIHELTSCLVK